MAIIIDAAILACADEIAEQIGADVVDQCYPASRTLARALRARGYDAQVVEVGGFKGKVEGLDPHWRDLLGLIGKGPEILVHFLVAVDDITIDLTYRQLDDNAEAVRVRPRAVLGTEWKRIETLA